MKEEEIRTIVESKGYVFDGIVKFSKSDRFRWHDKDLKVTLNLGKKLEDLTIEEFERWVV